MKYPTNNIFQMVYCALPFYKIYGFPTGVKVFKVMALKTLKKLTQDLFDLQDTTASNSSDISNKYNRTWTSYSKSKGDQYSKPLQVSQKRKRSAEKKVGVTERPTKIFAHQVNAEVISSIFC